MQELIAVVVMATMLAPTVALASVGSRNATYFGGTAGFKDAREPVEGGLDTRNETARVFSATDKGFRGQTLSIPYKDVIDLEYGQKAGRRVGAAIGYTILLGPVGLLTLFSKKRSHYLTIGFKDSEGKDQIAILELGKDIVRATVPIVETRSGKKVTYQDEEARKSVK